MDAVRDRQCTSGLLGVRRIAERGVGAELDTRQVDNVLPFEAGHRSCKR